MSRPTDPRVLQQVRPARGPLLGVLTGSGVAALLVIAQAYALTGLVVAAVRNAPVTGWAVMVVVTLGLRALVGLAVDLFAARAAEVVATWMRGRLAQAVLSGGQREGRASVGELTALATRGVTSAGPYLTRYLPALVLAAVLPPVTLLVLAVNDPLAALIVVATLPLVPVFGALVGLATRDRADRQWRALAALSGHFVDVVKGLPTLVAHRRAEHQSRVIAAVSDRARRTTLQTLRIAFASSAILELVATLSVALVAVVVGVRLASGGLDLHTALVVLLLAPEAYWPLRRVGAEFHASAEGIATFERLDDVEGSAWPGRGDLSWDPATGRIRADGITVSFPGRAHPVLDEVSVDIPGRRLTAIVGSSGAGKSTLMRHLLIGLEESGAEVSWLPQRPTFLAGSVRDNLLLAAPEATDAALMDVLSQVALEERVVALGGLGAEVGEDARLLSAGERARLALARLLLARRPVALLDEPTAHLDPVTEQVILDAIVALAREATVVVVAHRTSVIDLADHVITVTDQTPPHTGDAIGGEIARPDRASDPSEDPSTPTGPARRTLLLPTLAGAAASAAGVALTATSGWLIVTAAQHPPVLTMLVAIVGVRTFGLARPVLRYLERIWSHDVALGRLAEERVATYDALVPLVPGALGVRRGDVLASIVEDVESTVDRLLRVRLPLMTAALVAVVAAVVTGAILPVAGLITAVACIGMSLPGFLVARIGSAGPARTAVRERGAYAAAFAEFVAIAPELAVWQGDGAGSGSHLRSLERRAAAMTRAERRTSYALAVARALPSLVSGVAAAWMATVVARQVNGPTAALLILVPIALLEPLAGAADAGMVSRRADAARKRLDRLRSIRPAVSDPTHPVPAPAASDLRVSDVQVAFGQQVVLRDLDLSLPEGTRLAVTGPSGSGKSTLAALLLRFLDPTRGEVLRHDTNYRALSLHDVRRGIALVDDDPHVFSSTVRENLRLARPDADDAAIEAALDGARLRGWLDDLGDGLDTLVGEGHAQVSGGERARLGLARALLADAPVLVLDEPTAHLDNATAEGVAMDLLEAAGHRTVVWITHGSAGLDRMDLRLHLAGPADEGPTSWIESRDSGPTDRRSRPVDS